MDKVANAWVISLLLIGMVSLFLGAVADNINSLLIGIGIMIFAIGLKVIARD